MRGCFGLDLIQVRWLNLRLSHHRDDITLRNRFLFFLMIKGNRYFLQTCFPSLLEADWSLLPSWSWKWCCPWKPSVCCGPTAWLPTPLGPPGPMYMPLWGGGLCVLKELGTVCLNFLSSPLRIKWSKSSQVPDFIAERILIQILTWGVQTLGEHGWDHCVAAPSFVPCYTEVLRHQFVFLICVNWYFVYKIQ